MCIDYLKKLVDIKEMKNETKEKVEQFIDENIYSNFRIPRNIVIAQGPNFTSYIIENVI